MALPAEVAQLVEHQLPKLRVASSSLVFRSKKQFVVFSHDWLIFCFWAVYAVFFDLYVNQDVHSAGADL